MGLTSEQRHLIEQCASDAASRAKLLALFERQSIQHQAELQAYDRAVEDVGQLNHVSWAMAEAANLEELLRAFATPIFDQHDSSVALFNVILNPEGDPEALELIAQVRNTDQLNPLPVNLGKRFLDFSLGRLYIEHPYEVISIADINDYALDIVELDLLRQMCSAAVTIMPLYLPAQNWTGMLLFAWPYPYQLTEHEIRLYELLRVQMAPLVENMRLFDKTHQKIEDTLPLLSRLPTGLVVVDTAGRIVETNQALARLTGFSQDKLEGRSVRDLLPDIDWTDLTTSDRQFFTGIQCRNGSVLPVQVNLTGFAVMPDVGWLVSITETNNSNASEAEARYRVAAEGEDLYVCRYGPDMILTYANDAYARLFKMTSQELLGRNILTVVNEGARHYIRTLVADPKPNMHEVRIAQPNGDVVWQQWTDQPSFDADGNLIEIQAIGRDITPFKEQESAVQDHLQQTQMLYHTARALIEPTDLDERLQVVVDGIAEIFDAVRVFLIVPQPAEQQIKHLVIGGPDAAKVADFPYQKLHEGLVGRVWRERQPILSSKGRHDEFESGNNHIGQRSSQFGSVMVAPLRYGDAMLGVVAVLRKMTQSDFADSDLELLMAQANQTSSAIQNARLLASLQTREAQYRAIVDQQSELITRFRPDLTFTFVNEAYCRFTGQSADELIGKSMLTTIFPERYNIVKQDYRDYIRSPRKIFNEHSARRHDGALRWMQWVREPIFNDHGELIEIQTVGRDITDLKEAQDALSRSEERYRRFIEAAPVGVMITRKTVVQYSNRTLVRLLRGQSPDEIRGKTVFDILHPDYHELVTERVERLGYDNEESTQRAERFVRLDGTVVDVEVAITPIEVDGEQLSLTFVRDITRRKASEKALHTFQTRLKALQQLSIQLGSLTSFNDFCRKAVELGRENLGFDRLGLWFIVNGYTVGSFGTDENGQTADERGVRYPIDEEFPGYHFNENHLLHYQDNMPLKGANGDLGPEGWHAMTALWDGHQVIGVLAADNLINQQPASAEQLELLVLYGSTLGQLATRLRIQRSLRQGEEAERRFQQQLRTLHEVSVELTKAPTLRAFCQRAVALGRQRLGFDRVSMWFVDDDDPDYLHGSYGIDEQGEVRDEWSNRLFIPDTVGSSTYRVLSGEVLEAIDHDMEHRDAAHSKLGNFGWVAVAGLRDGERIIGCVYVDNYFGQKPLGRYQLELLRLYGTTLGHLATRLRTQEALAHSEARYRAIYEGAGIGICVVDDRGQPITFNPVFEELLGYDADELRQMKFSDFTHPDDRENNQKEFEALRTGEINQYRLVKRYVKKDKSVVWGRLNVSRFPSRDRKENPIIAMIEDITAQKEAELHYQESEVRRLALLEALPDLIFMLNRDGIFLDYHAPDQANLLIMPDAFLSQHYADVLPAEIVSAIRPHFKAVVESGRTQIFEYPVIQNDQNEYFETRMIAYGDQHILAIVRNITESRWAEEQLRESEERFRQIAENVDEIFFVQDAVDKQILYVNPAYEHIWARSRTALLRDPLALTEAVHPDDRAIVQQEMGKTHDRCFDLEFRVVRAEDDVRWMWARNFPIENDDGQVYRIAGVIKDVTERKQFEAKNLELALQQERVKILSDFIRDASHEFRTPLSIINSKVYLASRVNDPDAIQNQLRGIQDQSDHILRLVESLVTMTRLDSQIQFEMHDISINSLAQAIHARHQPMVSEHNIDFSLEMTTGLPHVAGDVDELYAAVVHLINNAVAHTSPGGSITLRTGRMRQRQVMISVEDNGSGVAEDQLPRIFEKFYRGDEAHSTPGFGLGLPIAQKIVEGHGGQIKVTSQPNVGSKFTIILPT